MIKWICYNFLVKMFVQDYYKENVDAHQRLITFNKGDIIFLRMLDKSNTSKRGSNPKLSSQFCGHFKIIKKVGHVTYKLELTSMSQVHLVFHVSHLRKWLYSEDNVVDKGVLVEYTKTPSQPHELE